MPMIFNLFPVLEKRQKQKSETLSGGEQQMLALGRALMGDPRFLVLDEPSLGLSPILVSQMMILLRRICKEMELAVLLVEQNAHSALKIATEAHILERGQIVLSGTSSELRSNPRIQQAYLGA
jgi:branched-chain amino acid transport system ATP-binding protein